MVVVDGILFVGIVINTVMIIKVGMILWHQNDASSYKNGK